MPEETLILKRDPDAVQSEHYDVLFEGRYVGGPFPTHRAKPGDVKVRRGSLQ